MAKLLKCIDCKKPFSSNLDQCPHCQSRFPQGVRCYICKKLDNVTNLEHKLYGRAPEENQYIDNRCLIAIKNEFESKPAKTKCPTCRQVNTFKINFEGNYGSSTT